jgi:PAS domain S-box-containing protein
LPDNITLTDAFLNAINQAYHDFDKDVKQAENILELSSKELFIANKELEKNVASKSAEAEALSKRLSRIVNNVQEVIFQTDLNGCWSFLNSAWERITGYNVEESIGTSFTSMVYPADKEKSVRHLSDLINGDETSRRYNLRYITKSGEVRWTEAIVSLDLDSEGRLLGASGTLTDINARYVAEEKLLQSSENLNQAQALTKLGSFEHPLHSDGVSYWSPQMYELLQCDTSFEPNLAYLVGSFDEGSRTLLNKAIDKLKDGDTEISLELRMKEGESYTMLRAEKHVGRVNKGYVVSGTLMDITERKSFERELISAKLLAERALAAKSEFLSNMSHEIRTPMNAIVGLTEIVLNEKDLNPQTRRNLELIDYSADNLLVIINDILDYSKIEANKVVLERITFDLKGMLSKLLETWRLKADHNQVGLILNWDKEIPSHMVGDPYRLNQILLNLVSNALKFTGQGSVTLKLSLTEKKLDEYNILFEVMDTGMGISQDKLESIFESFTQAYTDTTRNFGGTGLGLAISKRLVELQGGRIHVSSVVGEGSNFSFNIPLYTSTGAAEVTLDPKSDLPAGLHGINILVAEDNKINQLLIKQVCKNWNASIEIADDGEIAVQKSQSKNFDVILMDLQMPNMNGFEAVQAIRLDEENRNNKIPILALTADAMPETKSYVQRNGFNGYVTKPFKSYELLREITRCIEAVTQ